MLFIMLFPRNICHFCKANTETITHLFYDCTIIKRTINEIEDKINRILEADTQLKINLSSANLVLGFLHESSQARNFINFILILSKWEIWKLRNKIKFDNRQFSVQQIIDCILLKVRTGVSFLSNTSARNNMKRSYAFGIRYK